MLSALLLGQAALMVAAPSLWPQPEAVTGENDLRGGDPERRVAAVIRLGTVGTPEALRRIEPFLSAPDSSLRLAAARALVRAGDDQALARITAQASTQAAPARLEALMILREAAALPAPARHAAERALGDGDAAMRLAALELLTLHTLQSPVQARLCSALAHAASPAADELLATLLSADLDPGVRATAGWAAQMRRTEPAVGRALARAQEDREAAVRRNATVASSAASAPPLSLLASDRGWVRLRVRMLAPGGAPIAGRWVRITAGVQAVWGLTDESGEATFADLPPGPYRLSTAGADQLALTSATASGRSPATTPVGP